MPSINARAAAAASPDASPDDLLALSRDVSVKVRTALAANPVTPVEALRALAHDPRHEVRWSVVDNPSDEARQVIVGSADPETRRMAARRTDLRPEDLEVLSGDPSAVVRAQLALECTDASVLGRLARDEETPVRAAAAENPHLRPQDAEALARDPRAEVRAVVAAAARLSDETLMALADDPSDRVRWGLLTRDPALG